MSNRDTDAIWHYHNETKHSYWSLRTGGHQLDFATYPVPFKIYPEIDTPEFTQFKCPLCGKIETWGITRRQVAKTLYERFQHVGVGE